MARPSVAVPNSASAPPAAPVRSVTPVTVQLITGDDSLWATLAAQLPALRWAQFDSVEDYLARVPTDCLGIALLDARELAEPGAAVARLLGHAASVVPVAYTKADDDAECRRLLRANTLYELIPEGLATAAMSERLERAAEEAQARRALLASAAPAEPAAATAPAGAGRGARRLVIAAAALGFIAISLAIAYLTRERGQTLRPPAATVAAPAVQPPPPVAAPVAPRAPAAASHDVDDELAAARRALRDKRYVDPDNDSALSHFQSALAGAPDNAEAREGLERVNEVLLTRAETALAAHDFPAALHAVETSRTLFANHPRLGALDQALAQQRREVAFAQILAAIQADNFDRATSLMQQADSHRLLTSAQLAEAHAALTARQGAEEVASLLRLATARLDQGKLIEPARDSAKAYLGEALVRATPANQKAVRRLRDDYQRALEVQLAAATQRHDEAARSAYARELAALGVTSATASPVEARPAEPARAVPAVEPPAPAVVAAEPRPASEPATPAATADSRAAGQPPRLAARLNLEYPAAALRREQSGWVDVEVRVSATGGVDGVRVVNAVPARVFDDAALEAIRRARFAPATGADGTAVAGSGTIRVRFELPGSRR